MEYNSLIISSLNQFKTRVNSFQTGENSRETLKMISNELDNVESLILIHSHKIGNYSVFLSEIQSLRLKILTIRKMNPTPQKKHSFFTQTLAKMKENYINKVSASFIRTENINSKDVDGEDILNNNQAFSKKKIKTENFDRNTKNPSKNENPMKNEFFMKNTNIQNEFRKTTLNNEIPQDYPLFPQRKSFDRVQANNPNSYFPDQNMKNTYQNININNNFANPNTLNSNISNNNYYKQYNSNNTKNTYKQQQQQFKENNDNNMNTSAGFVTAKDQLRLNNPSKYQPPQTDYQEAEDKPSAISTLNKKFQPPYKTSSKPQNKTPSSLLSKSKGNDDKIKGIDQKMIETIESEILDNSPKISWMDIAGLDSQKTKIIEMIVWPFSNPDIFKGIRAPPRGLLLFGPPGTGKTMIGKAIASDTNFTFFSISASSLTSKWVGEGEKMVKALFMLASAYQPAVIFIDEVDSLLCSRSENENEASRRIKTEFLCQMEGTNTNPNERLLFIGATNRPQELDDAALRRFVKKLYIPLPNHKGRASFLKNLIQKEMEMGNSYELDDNEIEEIVHETKGYSGADLRNLCAEAALNPIRDVIDITKLVKEKLRATNISDFKFALKQVKPTVSQKDLKQYLDWNKNYGTVQFNEDELEN